MTWAKQKTNADDCQSMENPESRLDLELENESRVRPISGFFWPCDLDLGDLDHTLAKKGQQKRIWNVACHFTVTGTGC